MAIPMLADFSIRLAGGMSAMLLLTPWRAVPPAFYRTHCHVILGLLVLGTLTLSREGASSAWIAGGIAAAVFAFLGAACWGLGLARLGFPVTCLVLAISAAMLVQASAASPSSAWAMGAGARLSSAFLLGSTLTAMLLGHHYLTAPAMSISPLRRFVQCMAVALLIRAALGLIGGIAWATSGSLSGAGSQISPMVMAVRWGMGLAGPALATYMVWETVKLRSTQSATGILYIAMTLVLFGELTAMLLSRSTGLVY